MSEFKIPKVKYRPPTQEELFKEKAEMSYQPIIEIASDVVRSKLENDVFEAIYSYGINVDKDELIKALKYDRQQYEKGFADGCRHSIKDFKAEVAREILNELLKMIADEDNIFETCASRLVSAEYSNGRSEAIGSVLNFIGELKKKYTEEE